MKVNKNGNAFEFIIDGSLGEGSPLFEQNIRDATQVVLDMEKVTYINSVGVKTWILWTSRLPPTAEFVLRRVPLVIVNQASTVMGFMPAKGQIESFFAPFICPSCDTESSALLSKGKDYEYGKGVNLPKPACPKCKAEMEPDFMPAKTFGFLDLSSLKK